MAWSGQFRFGRRGMDTVFGGDLMIYQKKYTYTWRINNQPVDAQSAGEHLAALELQHNSLTPELVLDDARPSDALLHPCFEWDDTKAAEKYRVEQARYIIGNIVVHIEQRESEKIPETTRAFISITTLPHKGEFVSVKRAFSNDAYHEQILQNARAELRAFQKKYNGLTELDAVFSVIDQVCADQQPSAGGSV